MEREKQTKLKDVENAAEFAAAPESIPKISEKSGRTSRMSIASLIRKYIRPAAYFGFTALLSSVEFSFGTYPFGFALLCAAEGRDYLIAAMLGTALGSLFADGGGYVTLAALVIVLARILIGLLDSRRRRSPKTVGQASSEDVSFPPKETPKKNTATSDSVSSPSGIRNLRFAEELPLRCALAAAGAIVVGGIGILFHGNIWRAAAAMVLSAAVAPILCAAYAGFFHRRTRNSFVLCLMATAFSASWILSGIRIGVFGVGAAFALLVSLVGAHFLSIPEAILSAFVVSLPLEFAVIPAILLATAIYGLVRRNFPILAAFAGGACAIFFSLGSLGLSAASRYGGEFLTAAALTVPISHAMSAIPARFPGTLGARFRALFAAAPPQTENSVCVYESSVGELRSLSECFSSLGELAKGISHALVKPSETQIRERVSRSFEKRCASCKHQEQCWRNEENAAYRRALSRAIRQGQGISSVAVPSGLTERCADLTAILRSITPRDTEPLSTAPSVFARDLTELGALLADVSDRLGGESVFDEAAERALKQDLLLAGVVAESVHVVSPRLHISRISGVEPSSFHADTEDLRKWVSRSLGAEMTEPRIAVGENGLDFTLRAKEKLRVVMGKCSVSAKEGVCGDSASAFVSRDGYFRALLSDGMGSGSEAAFTAMTVTLFLERLLSAGVPMASALRITNSFLRERQIECSATVDVVELDLVRGGANFYKSGAAPSFVLRSGKLFKLRSRTIPIGILPSADAEAISFDVIPGDIIVMLSDGVTQNDEDCPWLYDTLCDTRITNLTATAKRIAEEAERRSADDVTVMLLRVEKA